MTDTIHELNEVLDDYELNENAEDALKYILKQNQKNKKQ
jgi:hypothetical protein